MPNRATFFTGRMPSLHGSHCNGAPLDLNANTMLWLLRDAGYRTHLVGKSHLQNMTGRDAVMPRPADAGQVPPPSLGEARLGMWRNGRYDQENTVLWQTDAAHGLDLPYYGFDAVDLCTMHGDVVGGAYRRWLMQRCPEAEHWIGPANAMADPRYRLPQAYRTRLPEALYPTSYVVELTQEALRASALQPAQPFFLSVCFPDPHHPFTPPGKYWDMYDPDSIPIPPSLGSADVTPALAHLRAERTAGRANTLGTMPFAVDEREAREAIALSYGMISMVDDGIGRILQTLAEVGQLDNTVVIFTSDHGDFMGDHGLMLKSTLHYQGLVRVPFIWSEPGLPHPGESTTALHSTLDVARSVLVRAGLQPYWGMQGLSLDRSLADPKATGQKAVLVEEDGHEVGFGFDAPARVRTILSDHWRMSIYENLPWGELYDLNSDPHELVNLFEDPAHQPVRSELFEQLARLMMAQADRSPFPTARA
jgi:arylsulfatase A-like enzyme